jgi:hypothetical protein
MKHFFYLTAIALTIAACGGGSDKDDEQTQDYTSFIITLKSNVLLPNVVSGYFDSAGYCWKIAEHGDLSLGQTTAETTLTVDIDSIYLFTDYDAIIMFTNPFAVVKNKKNTFELNDRSSGTPLRSTTELWKTDSIIKADRLRYPQ